MSRAARYTIETNKTERYSDFLTNLDLNPVTGFLGKAINDHAIAVSLKNIILTPQGHWPFESSLGSKIASSLFNFNDERNRDQITSTIGEAIRLHEPRVNLESVVIDERASDNNAIYVSLYYSIINIPDQLFELDVVVTRVR